MYLAGGKGFVTFDVSKPLEPVKKEAVTNTGLLSDNGGAAMLVTEDRTLYLAGGKGLGVYDISGEKPVLKVNIDTGVISSDGNVDLKIIGDSLFVCAGKGLATFDRKKLI